MGVAEEIQQGPVSPAACADSGRRDALVCGATGLCRFWSCMAFHLAGEPFYVGSDVVGMFGLCGIIGAVAASGVGKYVP